MLMMWLIYSDIKIDIKSKIKITLESKLKLSHDNGEFTICTSNGT